MKNNKTNILKTLSIVIMLTVVIIGINSNKKGVVFAQDSSTAIKIENKVNEKVNKIMKKVVSKKDSYNVKYKEKGKEGSLQIKIKLDKYSEQNAYEIAKKSIEKIDKKYSSKIDTYKFHISAKNEKNAINFDITRSKLKKVKLKKIDTKEFMQLAQNIWIYTDSVKYKVESIDDISVGSAKRKVMNVVVEGKYTLNQLYNIAKKEALQYTKENKVNALVVGFYTDKNHIGKGYDMGSVLYAPNGKIEDATKIKSGDYSDFKFVNELEEAIEFPKGKELKETKGTTNIDTVKKDILPAPKDFDVKIDESKESENGKVRFNIKTNLPNDTELMVGLTAFDGDYRGQTHTIVKDGQAQTEWFSDKGEPIKSGRYKLSTSMSMPVLQPEAVRKIVGENGEYMKGNLVQKSSIDNSFYISKESTIEL